jgi:DNA-binding NtrC family response regulator
MKRDKLSVLILDDEKVIRESLVDFFTDCGWIVRSSETAEEALEILDSFDADGAIVDMRLPGMDGNSFIIKAHAIKQDLVFAIVTGSPEYAPPSTVRSLQRVCNKDFTKPVQVLEELESSLKKCIVEYKQQIRHEG